MWYLKIAWFLLFIGIGGIVLAEESHAGRVDGLSGEVYQSYEECILDRMQGVTSDVAAQEIKRACAKVTSDSFCSERELTKSELAQLTGMARLSISGTFIADIYNDTDNLEITELSVQIIVEDFKGRKVRRKYDRDLSENLDRRRFLPKSYLRFVQRTEFDMREHKDPAPPTNNSGLDEALKRAMRELNVDSPLEFIWSILSAKGCTY